MYGSGPTIFAVWSYILAHVQGGQVEVNPQYLAAVIGMSVADVEAALAFLCAPDPRSRSDAEGGRRLVKEGTFAYRVVNYAHYQAIRSAEDRQVYLRNAKRKERAGKRDAEKTGPNPQMSTPVNTRQHVSTMSTHIEEEEEADVEEEERALPNGRELPVGNAPALFPDADGENPATIQDASFRAAILKDLWNTRTTAPLPKCLSLSKGRTTKAKTRLVEHGPEWWTIVIDRIQASDFCRGKNDRGWLASFDWLVSSQDPGLKVLEGKYDNRALTTTAAPRLSDEAILADIAAQKALRQVRR